MSKTLMTEIRNVALITAVMSVIQIIIAAVVMRYGVPAVLGTIVGWATAIVNFALMGFILEMCLSGRKGSSGIMGFGYIARLAFIAAAFIWAVKADYLNYVCMAIPLLFPQISIYIINIFRRKERKAEDNERT